MLEDPNPKVRRRVAVDWHNWEEATISPEFNGVPNTFSDSTESLGPTAEAGDPLQLALPKARLLRASLEPLKAGGLSCDGRVYRQELADGAICLRLLRLQDIPSRWRRDLSMSGSRQTSGSGRPKAMCCVWIALAGTRGPSA